MIAITEPVVASLSHVPCDCLACCHTWLTTSNTLLICHFLVLRAMTQAKVHLIWRRPAAGTSLPSCKISARLRKWSMRYALPNFFSFWPWPKGQMTCYPPRFTILPNFIALYQTMPEISVTKNPADKDKNKQ